MKFDPKLAKKAGVEGKHIARLLSVSRFTANNWLSGRRAPHKLVQARVDVFMRALSAALMARELPVKEDAEALPEEKSVALLRVLRNHMDKLNKK